MPEFVEFSREDSRSRREDPQFTWQARGLLSFNQAVYMALGQPEAVTLLYDAREGVVGIRKADPARRDAYQVRKQQRSRSYVVGAQGFAAYHGIQTLRARRFIAHHYGDDVWGFVLSEGAPVQSRRGAREHGPAMTTRWRHTTNGFEVPALLRINDVAMSHPGYMRQFNERPPSVRVGTLVASDPLGAEPPTSEVRAHFLEYLSQGPVMELVTAVSRVPTDAAWTAYAGHGRTNVEAVLMGKHPAAQESPIASALMLLPEAGTSGFGRDPRFAEIVLHIEPRGPDSKPAPAVTLATWHKRLVTALNLPNSFAQFLTGRLGLATSADPPAQFGVWLNTPHTMSELVDISGLHIVPGTQSSNQFMGWALADPLGQPATATAAELLRQMCDYTLHADRYEELLASFVSS